MNAPTYLAPFCNIFVVFQMNMERLLKVQFTKCTVLQQFDIENVQEFMRANLLQNSEKYTVGVKLA